MTVPDTVVVARPRAFWADVRFLLGVVLIVVSVVGVWLVVSASRQTAPVLAAAHTIVPGEVIGAGDLRVVDVGLGHLDGAYAVPGAVEPGSVATRTIAEGELVPLSAVGEAGQARTTALVLTSATEVPASVVTGSAVEVWSAPRLEHGVYDTPRVLLSGATVVSVQRDASALGGGGTSLELVIDRSDVAAALEALAQGASLSVVPTAGAGS
jgi:hypothetical protein